MIYFVNIFEVGDANVLLEVFTLIAD